MQEKETAEREEELRSKILRIETAINNISNEVGLKNCEVEMLQDKVLH